MKTIDDIQNVMIAGAGTLGMRIALRCALDGFNVRMYDINAEQLEVAKGMQSHLTKVLLKKGKIDEDQAKKAVDNLLATSSLDEAIESVDLVSESVIEDIDIKLAFYGDLTPRLPSGTIVTTNTSFLLPSQMLPSIREPEYFCAFHFHDVITQPIVDVMPHPKTEQGVIDLLMAFGTRINHIPVFVKKESNGYLFNAMFGEILAKAGELYMNDVGSIEDIDRSFMGNFHTPAGPFGMMDQIGLDTVWHIMSKNMATASQPFAAELKQRMEKGNLGYKSGEGFYSYPRPDYAAPEFLNKTKTTDS